MPSDVGYKPVSKYAAFGLYLSLLEKRHSARFDMPSAKATTGSSNNAKEINNFFIVACSYLGYF
jgi:hypothetical protein